MAALASGAQSLDPSALGVGGAGAPVAASGGPNLSKYMRMLKVGVPLGGVKRNMAKNGITQQVINAFNGSVPAAAPAPLAPQGAAPAAPALAAANQGNALQQLYASLDNTGNTSINALVTTISGKVKALIETAGRLRDKIQHLAGRPNVSDDTIREVLRRVEAFKSRIRESLGRLNGQEATQLGTAMGELEGALDQLLQRGSPAVAAHAAQTAVRTAGGSVLAANAATQAASAAASRPAGGAQLQLSPANLVGAIGRLRPPAAQAASAAASRPAGGAQLQLSPANLVGAKGRLRPPAGQAAVVAAEAAQQALLASGASATAAANAATHAAALAAGGSASAGNSSATAVLAAGGSVASVNAAQEAEAAALAAGVAPAAAADAGVQAAVAAAPAKARSALLANIEAQRPVLRPVQRPAALPTAQQQLIANLASRRAALTPPAPLAPLAMAPVRGQPVLNPPVSGAYVGPESGSNRLARLRAAQLQAAASAASKGNNWDPNANNGTSRGVLTAQAAQAAQAQAVLAAEAAQAQAQQLAPSPVNHVKMANASAAAAAANAALVASLRPGSTEAKSAQNAASSASVQAGVAYAAASRNNSAGASRAAASAQAAAARAATARDTAQAEQLAPAAGPNREISEGDLNSIKRVIESRSTLTKGKITPGSVVGLLTPLRTQDPVSKKNLDDAKNKVLALLIDKVQEGKKDVPVEELLTNPNSKTRTYLGLLDYVTALDTSDAGNRKNQVATLLYILRDMEEPGSANVTNEYVTNSIMANAKKAISNATKKYTLTSPYNAKGGSRKTRCGCGLKFGGRRTRRVGARKTRKSRR